MELHKIQDIKLYNYIEIEEAKNMYYRGSSSITISEDGAAKLDGFQGFDFFTYFNSLSVAKWKKYTEASSFFIVLEVKGVFALDSFGHLPKERNHQKEWIGHFSYNFEEKDTIIIPIPKTIQSDIISFSMSTESDVYIYDAYYAADISAEIIKRPKVSIISNVVSDDNFLFKNIDVLMSDIFTDETYKNAFSWICIDKEKKLNSGDISERIKLIRGIDELDNIKDLGTHVIVADDSAVYSPDCLKRIYEFLSLLKEDYSNIDILGATLMEEFKNIQYSICLHEENDEYESDERVVSESIKTDLGVWNNIIDNEAPDKESENLFFPSVFYCTPVSKFDLSSFYETDGNHDTGNKLLKRCFENIRLSGVCSWIMNIGEKMESSIGENLFRVQNIIFSHRVEIEVTRNMYYRSKSPILFKKSKLGVLPQNEFFDFFTYFNSFSLEKWKKYTHVNNVFLVIDAKGSFDVSLFGHYKNNNNYQKELFGEFSFDNMTREKVIISFPKWIQSQIVGFCISTESELHVYDAYYATDIDSSFIKSPHISMVTTTFKKENYVRNNIELLKRNLLADKEYGKYFKWFIIDNGGTLDSKSESDDNIRIITNKNVGGAGGFAKGMMESLYQNDDFTHILLMDDDVKFIPESFKRLHSLLSLLKDEYADHFISGAMLKMGQPNIQHEDTGRLNEFGYHEAVKPNYDLNRWDSLLDNEQLHENVEHQYAAWWFCCIPTTVASLDNLPLPVFVRGDDVEYSLRNNAKFITMNGICIWHEGFEGKFSAALEYYQVNRNELAVRAMHPELSDVDTIGHIDKIFWEEMHKFNYKGASLLLDAIEDYMKGPNIFKTIDGEKCMKDKRNLDNKPRPLNPEIRAKVDFKRLYDLKPLKATEEKKFKLTQNGQEGEERESTNKKVGVIPYGWGYYPNKMYMASEIIAVDPSSETYVIFYKDIEKYNGLKKRYEMLMKKYNDNYEQIEKEYRDSAGELTGENFWKEYLG